MTHQDPIPAPDSEEARQAHERVRAEIDAQDPTRLSALNVDVRRSSRMVLSAVPRLVSLRERAARLPEFEIRCLDGLQDYALAVWFLAGTKPPAEARRGGRLPAQEMVALRAKLMMWAEPLAGSGKFSKKAVGKIKAGHRRRDPARDVVALVALYRSVWEEVRTMCGVTEADLERGAREALALFSAGSGKDNADHALRLRKAWTLLDQAYRHCQRAVAYLRFNDGDADTFAPNLRKNGGRRGRKTPAAGSAKACPGLVRAREGVGGRLGPAG